MRAAEKRIQYTSSYIQVLLKRGCVALQSWTELSGLQMSDTRSDGKLLLEEAALRSGVDFVDLIAQTSLWADPRVYRSLVEESGSGAWFPNTRRKKKNEIRGEVVDGITLDDNSKANEAIKVALGNRALRNFATCHVWPATCYDPRYHTNIANLVLLPRPIAGLSDHDESVEAALQYRAFELYGWHPEDKPPPTRPNNYPSRWLPPVHITPEIERSLRSRRGSKKSSTMSASERVDKQVSGPPIEPDGGERCINGALDPETYNIMANRIRRWALNSSSNVHIIIGIMARAAAGMDRNSLVELVRRSTRSANPSGAIASLMTCAGNAYGLVFVHDRGLVKIHPDLLPEVLKYDWKQLQL